MPADDRLVKALYASVTSDEAFAAVLGLLARQFGCLSAILMYVDPGRPDADIAISYGIIDAEIQKRYQQEFAAIDPAPAAMAQLRLGVATTTDRLFPPEMRAGDRFYNEFYRPLGLVETLGGPIANKDGRFGLLAVHRGSDRAPFGDDEIEEFERIMHHMTQAIELRRAFFEIEVQAATLARTVDLSPAALLIFSRAGHLTHANRAARRVLDRRDGLTLNRAGRLMAADPECNRQLGALFFGTRPALPIVMRVPRRDGATAYTLRVSALEDEPVLAVRSASGLLVTAHDPDSDAGDVTGLLATAFGLSPPVARLVAALLRGDALEAYARTHRISPNTVKFHLKTAFAMTGTKRQSDLIRVAGALVRDLTLPASADVTRPRLRANGG